MPELNTQRAAIRESVADDIETVYQIINEAARAYKSVLPSQVYHEPQMSMDELQREFKRVGFLACEENGQILGVMGYEFVEDIALIRHAYVRPKAQRKGIGSLLLHEIEGIITRSRRAKRIVIGTYTAASWAIAFYEKHGYQKSSDPQQILRRYYDIPEVQRINSLTLEKKLTQR